MPLGTPGDSQIFRIKGSTGQDGMKRLKSPKSGENGEAAGKQEEEAGIEGATGNWGIGFRECWGLGGER